MAPKYQIPGVPTTPSKNINSMLKTRCDKQFNHPVKAAIAQWICAVFTVITKVYNYLHKDKQRHSHTTWMVSCGLVLALTAVGIYLGFHSVVSITYGLYSLLFYVVFYCNKATLFVFGLLKSLLTMSAWSGLLGTAALCLAGMAFFDKEGNGHNEKKD